MCQLINNCLILKNKSYFAIFIIINLEILKFFFIIDYLDLNGFMIIANKLNNIELPKGGVFTILSKALESEKNNGKDKTITAVIGSLFDENENFFILDTVKDVYKNISPINIFNYAPAITGTDEFKEFIKQDVFAEYLPHFKNSHFNIVSTAGGTGAVANTIRAFLDKGQTLLLPNIKWESYAVIAKSNELNCEEYNLFKNDVFDINDFSIKLLNIVKKNGKVLAVINDPCHNPTGYSLTFEEWEQIIEVLKEASKFGDVILLNDIAYIDYDFREKSQSKEYLKLFADLPENILTVIAFSISKSLTSYGLRVGASIAISSSKKVIDEVDNVFGVLCRSTWSNISRGGMELFMELNRNKTYLNNLNADRIKINTILQQRSNIFVENAKQSNIKYLPYKSGFFFTVPIVDVVKQAVLDDLQDKNVFVVPVEHGIRIAICSLIVKKVAVLPSLLKESFEKIKSVYHLSDDNFYGF
jgi:aspartate aminotransferase/aromatic-amino-acid transaminase